MEELHKKYGDKVEFLAVYVREAHPTDGWRMPSNDRAGIAIAQPHKLADRNAVAVKCSNTLEISMPLLVDDIDDRVGHAYSGMPDRLYIIDRDGRVAYKGGRGPFGFKSREMEQSLVMLLLDQDRTSQTVHGFPTLNDSDAWKHLPNAEKGSGQPLPVWARTLAASLPGTTASMLELDYLHRVKSPLEPQLRAKMRWTAAHANHCAYSETTAKSDLRRAGASETAIAALEKGESDSSSAENAALVFARKMSEAANTVTDAEVSQLMGRYGNEQVVAMVLLLAYSNFQDRILLALGVLPEKEDRLTPLQVRFANGGAGVTKPVSSSRSATTPQAARPAVSVASDLDWQTMNLAQLQSEMEIQRKRQPRILVPTWEDVSKNFPGRPKPANPPRIKWSLVCSGYQPELASAWSACTRNFAREANQDRVFEESLFWVITRTLQCFY